MGLDQAAAELKHPGAAALADADGFEIVDRDILCHVDHQGAYTDLGSPEEKSLIDELRRGSWRDVVARRYARKLPWLYNIITDPSRSKMLDVMTVPPGGRFLDVGSGWGQVTIPLARIGETFAIDQTVNRLRILREIARQEQVQPRMICGNIHTLPLRNHFFDVIIVNGMLEYTNLGREEGDRAAHLSVLRKLGDALADDGSLYIGIENATGLKYILGAPDDHTGKRAFTYRTDRDDGAAARTWALDQYLKLFADAGLETEGAFGCFPDYKLIRHIVPLEQVDAFLLRHGLPAPEHSGADGAPLDLHAELRSLYQNFARMGIARYFVPSFGFVLKRAGRVVGGRGVRSESLSEVAAELLMEAGLLGEHSVSDIRLRSVGGAFARQAETSTARFSVILDDRAVASMKRVPLSSAFDPDAIVSAYECYQRASTFRPVRLLASRRHARHLYLLEEHVEGTRSLDELVAEGILTADEATDRLVTIANDVYDLGAPSGDDEIRADLRLVEEAFRALFGENHIGEIVCKAFCEMVRSRADALRTVISTRDYIGRNIARTEDGHWLLFDYDLARRTSLFALTLARNFIHSPHCTQRIFRAEPFRGLDPALTNVAAVAVEYVLQKEFAPPTDRRDVLRQYREHVLAALAPDAMEDVRAHQVQLEHDLAAAREYQGSLEREIDRARSYQKGLEDNIRTLEAVIRKRTVATVDIMVVSYNSARWLDGFVGGLRKLDYPPECLRVVFVDNGSRDDSVARMVAAASELPMRVEVVTTGRNLGFTGGYEQAFRHGEADYYFVVNLDTVIEPDAIRLLVDRMEADATIGIAEARQAPREHPKYYDPITGETSWCSGACMMVRPTALRQIGGGFMPSFFMYAEDVDLSWRMWLRGWKCIYVPEAVVQHFTEDLDPKKTPKLQHYYSMRNGALMRAMYGSQKDLALHYLAMLRVGTISRNPLWHKWGTLKAALASMRHLPAAIRGRDDRARLGTHRWVYFNGWTYGHHGQDLSLKEMSPLKPAADLHAEFPRARKRLKVHLPVDSHIVAHAGASVAGAVRPAILAFNTAEISFDLPVPADARLSGAVAAPEEAWNDKAVGLFSVDQNGRTVWQQRVELARREHRRWIPFEAPLEAPPGDRRSTITLRFVGETDLAWGLWGGLHLGTPAEENADADALDMDRLPRPAVSIVIPTHNRADRFERVIQRIMAQDIPTDCYEVIVVDSRSSDHTPQLLADLARRYENLTTLRCEKPGAAAARNMGLDKAGAPLVFLIDDDILVGRDFLRRTLSAAKRRPGRVLLGHIEAPWTDSVDPFERYLLQAQDVNIYNFPDNDDVPANYFYTACVAIPREVLGSTRFDEGFSVYGVEDIEFGFRLLGEDRRMVYLPDLKVLHDYYPKYDAYRRKKRRAGYSLGYFLQQHPEHAHRFVFERKLVKYRRALSLLRWIGLPVARLLYGIESIRYAPRPLGKWLYRWLYIDLRLTMYDGLLRFRSGRPVE